MSRRLVLLLALLALVIGIIVPVSAGAAGPTPADRFTRLTDGKIDPKITPLAADPDRKVTVMVELGAAPVAVEQAAATADLSASRKHEIRERIKADQAQAKRAIEAAGGKVLSQMQDAYNGMRVEVAAGKLRDIAAAPGVTGVHRIFKYEIDNSESVPHVFAPEVWESLGLTGQDVTVAIIDTGIDYFHADFGGSGKADFDANDPTTMADFPFTAKVVGGYDFVGDDYDASGDDGSPVPVPDPDPVGCHFHGTHVAGTAAGQGVLLDGSTFTGPYDTNTYTDNTFSVGPGVAPNAILYALKVFGCEGSTDVTTEAIDWAVAHDLDVINMSLGSPFGMDDDPSSVAANNAAAAGVIVVASAGNEGDGLYITGAPGAATKAISVAALDTIESSAQVSYTYDPGTGPVSVTMQNSNGAALPAGPLVAWRLQNLGNDENLGCLESDFTSQPPPGGWTDKVVITDRNTCARVDRATNGQAVGAAAVVMITNGAGYPPVEGPIAGVTIPFLGALVADAPAIDASAGQAVTLAELPPAPNPTFENLADFTSGGPRMGDSWAKPDVTAPGVSIVSALVGSGDGGTTSSGTSMAAPHVAGLAALVRQAHPGWSVEDVKAAIVNTANPAGVLDYSTRLAGSGLIDSLAATTTNVVAVGDKGTASLSYGYEESHKTWKDTKKITVRNLGSTSVTYDVSTEWNTTAAGTASISVSPSKITVAPGKEKKVDVRLTVDVPNVPAGFNTASGNIVLSGSGLATLRVPFMAVPRGRSGVFTFPATQSVKTNTTEVDFTSANIMKAPGTIDAYAWGMLDGKRDSTYNDLRAAGVQSFPDAFGTGASLGVFAINTYNMTSNAAVTEWDVLIDVGNDGSLDWILIGFDLGALTTGEFNGTLATFLFDGAGLYGPFFLAGGGINSSTVLLPIIWEDMGISASSPDFSYTVEAYSLIDGDDVDWFDESSAFDAFDESVGTGAYLELNRGDKERWTAGVDITEALAQGVKGWMLVSQENRSGDQQAQLVKVLQRRGHGGGWR